MSHTSSSYVPGATPKNHLRVGLKWARNGTVSHAGSSELQAYISNKTALMEERMGKDELITKEFLHQLFEYKDGVLYWKTKWTDKVVVGNPVGYLRNGYLGTKINKIDYRNHRLIFMMHHGYLPKIIDHIDGNPLNNKIENLRAATSSGNSCNSKKPTTNTSGKKGVCWKKDRNQYKVEIWVSNKPKFFGYYKDFDLACLVADEARNKYHKEFARHE